MKKKFSTSCLHYVMEIKGRLLSLMHIISWDDPVLPARAYKAYIVLWIFNGPLKNSVLKKSKIAA